MRYEVIYLGKPQAKERPKFNRNTGTAYTPSRTTAFESSLRFLAQKAIAQQMGFPFSCACDVDITVFKAVPSSWSKTKKEACMKNLYPVTCKPDIDNIAKSVLDALNGVFYTDDRFVSRLWVQKFYSNVDAVLVRCSEIRSEDKDEK